MTDDLVARLRRMANECRLIGDTHGAVLFDEAADALEAAEARVRELEAEVSGVSAAIGTTRFMDPPDGGSVTLSEQVARLRQALDAAEARLSTIEAETIERCAKVAKEIAEKHGKWKGDRLMKEAAEEVAFAVRKLAQEVR